MFKLFESKIIKKSVFKSLVLSYIVILVIPFSFSLLGTYKAVNGLRREIFHTNQLILEQSKEKFQNAIDDAAEVCAILSLSANVKSLLPATRPLASSQRYTIWNTIKNDIAGNQNVRKYVGSLFICYNYGSFVLTPSALYDYDVAYSLLFSNVYENYQEWENDITGVHYHNIKSFDDKILFIQSLPYISDSASANAVVFIDKQQLSEKINESDWVSDSRFYVLNADNEVIFSNTDTESYYGLYLNQSDSGEYIGSYDGKTVWASVIVDNATGFQYILAIDNLLIQRLTGNTNVLLIYYSIAAVIIGIGLAVLLARRSYLPIRQIVNFLSDKVQCEKDTNEYAFIDSSIRKIINSHHDIQQQMALNNEQVTQNFISRLLRRKSNILYIKEEAFKKNGVVFDNDRFMVGVVRINDYAKHLEATYQAQSAEQSLDYSQVKYDEDPLDKADYMLASLIRESLNSRYTTYICEANGLLAMVANYKDEDSENIIESIYNLISEISEKLKLDVTIAVGKAHGTYLSLPEAYDEAVMALERSLSDDCERFLVYKEMDISSDYYFSVEIEQSLISNLKDGNFATVEKIINEIFRVNLDERKISSDLFICLAYGINSAFIRSLESTGLASEDINPRALANGLAKAETASGKKKYLLETARGICDFVSSGKVDNYHGLLKRIMDYIEAHYMDTSLCNPMIAGELGISSAYLSRYFKSQTGEGLVTYINAYRVEKAKLLMLEAKQKYTLSDICSKIGFENVATFIRSFKKIEGITPGKYMELMNNS